MNPLVIAGAAAITVTAALLLTRKGAPPPAAAAAPPADFAVKSAGDFAPPVAPPAAVGAPPSAPKPGNLIGTVLAGINANNAVGNVVEKVAGGGAGDVARINVTFAPAILAKVGTEKVLAQIGVPESVAKHTAITVGAAALVGVPGIIAKGFGELGSFGIKAIAGEKVEQAVRGAVSQLDPTKPGSVANTVIVKPVASIIKGLGKIF
ncbi:hypothetical protein [Hyalangium sp.]|uniref:hypothetical protein n=1 Tax=Hyalangium sp. TaxID=2028555 RepID=UPI002D5B32D9|nr:hypothetical protein [Hyalangium sp.]HYI00569.1 hypothetical protein [Hyalangium sp.]